DTHLENAPLRLLNSITKEAVVKYFTWVMLSEPRLREILDENVYTLCPVGTMEKWQKFCEVARGVGHFWAWCDTYGID
ncbi:uncharacterized protein F5147DRAFT_587946, partial [Suillus discolor]